MNWARQLFHSLYSFGSIRLKVMGIVLALAMVLAGVVISQTVASLDAHAREQLSRQSVALSRDLAARSADLVLTHNLYGVREALKDSVSNNPDLRYGIIYDSDHKVVDSTFGREFPADLLHFTVPAADTAIAPIVLLAGNENIYDVVVPILNGRAGYVRVGVSDRLLTESHWVTVRRMLLETGTVTLGALIAAYFLTVLLTKPLEELVIVTRAVGSGVLDRRLGAYAQAELDQLAVSFNRMIDSLQASRERLLQRNRDLSVLNRVATAATQPLDRQRVLYDIITEVQESLGLERVCVFRVDEEGKLEKWGGLPEHSPCAVSRILCETGMQNGAPFLDGNAGVIPLMAEGRVTGTLCFHMQDGSLTSTLEPDMLVALGRHLGIALENVRLWERLKAKEALRAELLSKLITAQEEERKALALELHDQTGQSLTSLMVGLKLLEGAKTLDQARERVSELRSAVGTVLDEVHSLALELRPRVLDDLGLVHALDRYTRDFTRKFGVKVQLQAEGFADRRLPAYVGTTLFRIVQEALTNVARHSHAQSASVTLTWHGKRVNAIIHDDGVGFDYREAISRQPERLGLFSMRERATLAGGRLEVRSAPQSGTTILVQVPAEEVA